MASAVIGKELSCSVCLNTYTGPVTLRCGHNFCQVCIEHVLDTQEGPGVYNCPECREEFEECPEQVKNSTLSNVAEKFLSAYQESEETEILCTYCIHSLVPAVKSCLMCEASLCADHLKVHSKSEEHVLSDPTTTLGNRKCSVHRENLEYYCIEDSACICKHCTDTEHHGHHVELLGEALGKKKETWRPLVEELTSKKSEAKERVQILQKQMRLLEGEAGMLTWRVNMLFRDIRKQVDGLEKKVTTEISRQVEKSSLPRSDLVKKLDNKIEELSKNICHTEELCNMTDPLTVLQGCKSEKKDFSVTNGTPLDSKLFAEACHLDENVILEILQAGLSGLIAIGHKGVFMQESSEIFLDENTAGNNLVVLTDLKSVYWTEIHQHRPKTPQRFKDHQVLSSTSFSKGRHFWVVETSRSGNWRFGMSYSSIARKGFRSYIGCNNKSWGLCKWNNQYSVMHDCKETKLAHKFASQRFGIHLDYELGQLSFHELNDPIRHIYTFNATFTEPLHAIFRVWLDSFGGAWIILRHNEE